MAVQGLQHAHRYRPTSSHLAQAPSDTKLTLRQATYTDTSCQEQKSWHFDFSGAAVMEGDRRVIVTWLAMSTKESAAPAKH